MRKNGKIGGIFVGVLIFFIIIGIFFCSKTIPAGYVGVVYNMNGGIEKEVLRQGWRVTSPTKKIILYTVAREQSYMTKDNQGDSKDDESFEIPTKEGAALEVDVAFGYTFDEAKVPQTFTTFRGQSGEEILKTFIKPNMQGWIKEVTSRFGMIEIVSKERGTVNAVLTEEMEKRFEPYGIIIDKVSLTDVRPDKDTNKAIKNKIKAQEELETAKVKAEKDKVKAEKDKSVAEIAAQKDKSVAEINAEKVKIEAEAQAQAVKIKAEAEAEANKKISESLTDKLLEKKKIEKWKGDVPQVQGDASTIIDTRNLNQ